MTSLAEVQRAFTRICLAAEVDEADLESLHAPRERWLLYRNMVRSRLFEMCRTGLPRTVETLGRARFDAAVTRYLAEQGPRTRFIREVVHELVAFVGDAWTEDPDVPPHLGDLVRYEDLKWRVSSLEWTATEPVSDELDFEGVPVHNPTVRWTDLRFRVDRVDERANEPLDAPHRVLVFRKPGDARIYSYVLNPMGTKLYEAWRVPDRSLADGVRAVLAAEAREPDPGFVDGMAGVLAGMVERSIVLGTRR